VPGAGHTQLAREVSAGCLRHLIGVRMKSEEAGSLRRGPASRVWLSRSVTNGSCRAAFQMNQLHERCIRVHEAVFIFPTQ